MLSGLFGASKSAMPKRAILGPVWVARSRCAITEPVRRLNGCVTHGRADGLRTRESQAERDEETGPSSLSGEKRTLPLVARHADIWSSTAKSPDELEHKIELLRRNCDRIGRDPDEIDTAQSFLFADPFEDLNGFLAEVDAYAAQGVSFVAAIG